MAQMGAVLGAPAGVPAAGISPRPMMPAAPVGPNPGGMPMAMPQRPQMGVNAGELGQPWNFRFNQRGR